MREGHNCPCLAADFALSSAVPLHIPCHGALTTVTPIDPAHLDALRELLDGIDKEDGKGPLMPFEALSTVHFARLAILTARAAPDGYSGEGVPPQLLFAT